MALPSASTVSTGAGVLALGVATFVGFVVLAILTAENDALKPSDKAILFIRPTLSSGQYPSRKLWLSPSSQCPTQSRRIDEIRVRSARSSCSCERTTQSKSHSNTPKRVTRIGVATKKARRGEGG